MEIHFEGLKPRRAAQVAGITLLLMALVAGLTYGVGFQKIYDPTDAPATFRQVMATPLLLPAVILGFLLILLLDVLVAWAFYWYFRPLSVAIAQLIAWLRLLYAGLLGVAIYPLSMALLVLKQGPAYAKVLLVTIGGFVNYWSLGLIVFAAHLLVLGLLMWRYPQFPKALSLLVLLAAACYFGTNLAKLLWTGYALYQAAVEAVLALPMALGELGLAVWLLLRGGRAPVGPPRQASPDAAE